MNALPPMFKRKTTKTAENQIDYDSQILAKMSKLYPHASQEQLIEGKQNLEEYLETAWKIAERLDREAQARDFDSGPESSYHAGIKVESHP